MILNNVYRILSLVLLDIIICILCVYASYFVRIEKWSWIVEYNLSLTIYMNLLFFIPLFVIFGIYQNLIQYFNISALLRIIYACILVTLINFMITSSIHLMIPRSIALINGVLFCSLIIFSRLIIFQFKNFDFFNKNDGYENVILYGAGKAGRQILSSLLNDINIRVKAIIDDDINKQYRSISNLRIFPRTQLQKLMDYYKITTIIVALANIDIHKKNQILNFLNKYDLKIKFLPQISDLISDTPSITDLKNLNIHDLLMRDIKVNKSGIRENIYNKKLLVTGAGGSIGSELCVESLNFEPKEIILLDHSEFNLYKIDLTLREIILEKKLNTKVISILASIKDEKRIDKIFEDLVPDIIYHTAAYKHVSIVHNNTTEALSNNIIGTLNVTNAAIKIKCSRFVLVSTDKAVRPTNIMGASKRFAELIIQAKSKLNENSHTKFAIVRFGNVLGSSGSVIPIFTKQIQNGGPVTVRDKNVTRYFMHINEAVRLILEADSIATGGEVFILNMGEPIRIYDLAEKMIHLSGSEVKKNENDYKGIEIKISKLLESEKLYEELLIVNKPLKTINPDIMKANEEFIEWSNLDPIIKRLILFGDDANNKGIIEILKETTYLNIK